ncbi:MAG: hypothetical protein D6732_07645, partial [Methanobacteriota archaeon]
MISKIAVMPDHTIWIGTLLRGINVYSPASGFFEYIDNSELSLFRLPENRTRSLYVDPLDSNILWVGFRLQGIARINIAEKNLKHIPAEDENHPLPDNYVLAFSRDFQNRMWIGTSKGLVLWDEHDSLLAVFKNNPADPFSISANDISSLYLDRTGNLWIGTLSGGLNRIDTKPAKFSWLKYYAEPGRGLNNPLVWAILKTRGNRVLVGTDEGITIFNSSRNHAQYITAENSILKSNYIQAFHEDERGDIWIGTYRGLYRMHPSGEIEEVPISLTPEGPQNSIICFRELVNDTLLIGTENGLVILDKTDLSFTRVFQSLLSPPEPTSVIYSVVVDTVNHIYWLGTYGGGVVKYNYKTGARTYINSFAQKGRALSNDYVFCMIRDPLESDILWIGTRTGLNKLDMQTGEITFYTELDGLPNDVINSIQVDQNGNLWMSTNKGLVKWDRLSSRFISFDLHDGLQDNEFNARAGFRAHDGEIFFGGINGVTAFYPEKMFLNPFTPLPRVKKIYIRDRLFIEEGEITQPVKLGYDQNFITIEYFVPEYSNINKNKYLFRLYPFEKDWRSTLSNRVEYTNIPSGKYVFQLKYVNNDHKQSPAMTQLVVNIATPPWRTWWAYLLYVAGFGMIVLGIVRYRIHQIKEEERLKRAELRAQVAEAEKRAIEIENLKKSEEMERARELQLAMLPDAPPEYNFLEIETYMETASIVGGDYYDFLPISKDQLYAAIGDATGHGLAAGMTVALTKSGLKAIEGVPPVDILKRLNKVLKDILSDKFYMALHLLQITPTTVTLSSAAMPPVYYYNEKLKKLVEVLLPSLPLGTRLPDNYQEITIHFNPGDTLVLLSDGLPERMNSKGIPLGYNLVKECIEENIHLSPKELMEKLIGLGEQHADGS